MTWNEIKNDIEQDLLKRNLSDPSIRIRAISSVENLLNQLLVKFSENPNELCAILDKDKLKELLSSIHDNGKLNGAQESIINEIYYRL